MFRIEFLKLENHPQLGSIDLNLSDNLEYKKAKFPYTSVIIGSNGTGKSFILKTIAEIFRQFQEFSISNKREFNLPYSIHLRYKYYHNTYEIVTRNLQQAWGRGGRKEYLYFKNRPLDIEFKSKSVVETITGYEVLHGELEYPTKLLVNSIMNNDRFVFKNTEENDFYQYLGARSTSSSASTKSSVKRTIKHVFNARNNEEFVGNLKELLTFLEFEESFKVLYKTKINKLFFSQQLTVENFRKYFEEWWDKDFEFTNRSKENPLWSIPHYNKYFKDNLIEIKKLVNFLNNIPSRKDIFRGEANTYSKSIEIDLFDDKLTEDDLHYIRQLEYLDIINVEGIKVNKSNNELSINEISSGEFHILVSLIGIFANISHNSLVLIDEPEISLHPNWQMKYISFLKTVFQKYSDCHFILTTHSHFLVSDLEDSSSYLTGLKRENSVLTTVDIDRNTYGWSAEEVLYKVFDVRTTRNYYLEIDLRELLHKIAIKSDDFAGMKIIYNKLKKLELSMDDPLNLVLNRTKQYLDDK